MILIEATPPDNVPVPRVLVPSLKVTVPVAALGVTLAVNVTDCPNTDVPTEDERAVIVLTAFTVWVTAPLLHPSLLSSPLYIWGVE